MIKRMMLVTALAFFCMSNKLGATADIYHALRHGIIGFGECIEKSDFPLIGKLTNLLPFGILRVSCKDYPGQTMMVCAGLLSYILFNNERTRAIFNTYKDNVLRKLGIKSAYNVTCDDTLFIFDGDDEEDAEEQMDMEDQLLADNDVFNRNKANKNSQRPFIQDTAKIKFL